MISYIVSSFNRPKALRTCLSSLSQQSDENWEAYVCDNSDNPCLVFENAYQCNIDPRVNYEFTGDKTAIEGAIHKYSLYTATEIGVKKAKGDWLCFPSCDSYYAPPFAERMLKFAKENKVDLVLCDFICGGAGGHHLLQTQPKLCCCDKGNFIMKKSCFTAFDKNPENYPCADGLMIEDAIRRGVSWARFHEVLYVHN